MLSRLDPQSFQDLITVLESNELSYEELTSDVSAMGHTLMNVNAEFQKVYASSYENVPTDRFDGVYTRWQKEILGSAQIAARSQATLSTLAKNAAQAKGILQRSAQATGEVAQMQAVVQMLGVMQAQSNAVLQSLTTTGRVLTSATATTASERQLAREKKQRSLAGYTKRGAPVPDVRKLP
jgi:conjugal transfer/entry exclusion protein